MSSELIGKGDIEETNKDQEVSDVQMQSDYVEEDSEVVLTLVVTSDEDSKESNSRQSETSKTGQKPENNREEKLNEKTDIVKEIPNITEGIDAMEPGPIILKNRSKRKASSECVENSTVTDTILSSKLVEYEAQWKNDDDFLGFNDIEESSEKRLKLTDEPQNDNITSESTEILKSKDESPSESQDGSTNNTKPKDDLENINSPKSSTKNSEVDKPPVSVISKLKHSKESLYRKPFDMGWKREFVYRAIPGISKEKGEVYYINPSGKKLRTRTEVSQHLTPGLTLENFTFSKEPLGFEEELIRSAKPTSRSSQSFPVEQNRELLGKRVPKPKAPKGASPPPQGWTATKAVKSTVVQSPRTSANARGLEEVDSKVSTKQNNKAGKSVKRGEPCTIQCPLAMGMIPQLQCVKCLCLFHHACVGLDRSESEKKFSGDTETAELFANNHSPQKKYICESCIKEPNGGKITPIKSTLPSNTNTQPVAILSSSQNPLIPRVSPIQRKTSPTREIRQSLTQTPLHAANPINEISHSSKIDGNNETDSLLPQSIAVIKGRKYVVIRKPSASHFKRSEDAIQNSDPANENSTADSSLLPALWTGDDLIVRKRLQSSRNKILPASPDSPQLSTQPRPVVDTFAANFFSNVSLGYDILIQIFQYLKVQELLRAGRVCRVWYVVANHRSLWRTVRMKNSQVNDWTGLAAALRRNQTRHLDLRKMLISSTNADEMWASFSKNIQTVVSLETIDLCKCSSKIVQSLFISNPSLKVLNAVTIKDETLSLENLERLENLDELRLKSIDGCVLEGDLTPLRSLKNLRHLSLTSFQQLGLKEIEIIGDMIGLESLELGECSEFGTKFANNVLPKLKNLERLRLEKGLADCSTLEILDTVSKLENLIQLELVNFDIKTGFDDKLALCTNIKRLLLIPTYISQSATTNNIVLNAVLQLQESLQSLTWAVTLELLRVTALYVDQCDNKKKDKKFFDESIPVLKPVPGIEGDTEKMQKTSPDVPQVEILPLVKVEKILTAGMPTTKFKILKVPYHATWRQNLVDN